jgi:putative endonuclease
MRHGMRLLARNHRCRFGELDLVMHTESVLVFVEVRFRRSSRFGSPAETIDSRKQRRLIAAAGHYLQKHPSSLPCRFDVVAISGHDDIHWIQNAFTIPSA